MSQQIEAFEKTLKAGEDMSTKQYYIVQLAVDGDLELGEGATDLLVGVLQNKPKENEAALYRFLGTAKVKAGVGGAAVGDKITSDASGTAIVTTTDKDTIIGKALQVADAGDIYEVQLAISTLSV